MPVQAGHVVVCGRVAAPADAPVLEWDGGRLPFRWEGRGPGPVAGDIVALSGPVGQGVLRARTAQVLAPAGPHAAGGPAPRGRRARQLCLRDAVLRAVRAFFAARGYVEVETPALVAAPGQESTLDLFRTRLESGSRCRDLYLVTSPEHHMKRLLGSGCERIYQVCRCYRNGERSAHHNPEFTMLEWYRAWGSYGDLMGEAAELVAEVAQRVRGSARLRYRDRPLDLRPPWPQVSVAEAFRTHAGIEVLELPGAPALCRRARQAGFASVRPDDTWEDAFHKVLLEAVEPRLAGLGAVFLCDYPARLAALAKLSESDPRVAERAEAYVAAVELANGFTELNDPPQQRRRFAAERQRRLRAGRPVPPLDRAFLAMLADGMPPAAGMALGVDRLAMVMADAAAIDEVMAFPLDVEGDAHG